jgi:CBS domain-containing protein
LNEKGHEDGPMICPSCGTENIQGDDLCSNCGTELAGVDKPQPGNSFEDRLINEPLSALAGVELLALGPEATAAEALRQMQERNVGSLVVEQDGRVVGIFTEVDALLKLTDGESTEQQVSQLMTTDPVVLRAEDSVAVAIHKMAVGGFRHIPLVENGHATGIVSARDLFRHILDVIA